MHPPARPAKTPHVSPTFAPIAAVGIVGGTLLSIFAATFVGRALEFRHNWEGVAVVYLVLFGTMTLWAFLLSKAFGTGSLVTDFGFRLKLEDIGWGTLALVGAMLGRIVVAMLLPQETRNPMDDVDRAFQLDRAALIAFSFAALIGAPLIEELVFRGVLQRGLTKVVGAPAAITIQGFTFAAYHFVPSTGLFTLLYFLSLAILGIAAGIAVEHTGRLGPAMIAHLLNNTLAVLILFTT